MIVDKRRRPMGREPRADERALDTVHELIAAGNSPTRSCEIAANGHFPFERHAARRLRKKLHALKETSTKS